MRTSQMLRHNRGAYAITPGEYHARMARVRAYQRVLAMADWTLFAPFDYRRWAGSTMAHRDAERSEAVAGDGDPLGLVDPLVGAPLVQEVSAERPVWTESGAVFGGPQHFSITTDGGIWDPITQTAEFTMMALVDWDLVTGEDKLNTIIGGNVSGSGSGAAISIEDRDGVGVRQLRLSWSGDAGLREILVDEALSNNGRHLITFTGEGFDAALRGYLDHDEVGQRVIPDESRQWIHPFSVGRPGDQLFYFHGAIAFVGVAFETFGPAQIARISDLLL